MDTEDKDLNSPLLLTSPADFRERPRYREDVDPTQTKPIKILAPYSFSEGTRCGLKNCHQSHFSGYLVRTADCMETNIGWQCGRKHFGVEFVMMRRRFDREEKTRRYSARLQETAANLDQLLERLNSMADQRFGGKWLYSGLIQFSRLYPLEIVTMLRQRGLQRELVVTEARRRTPEELAAARATNPGVDPENLRYVPERRGTLRGLSIFTVDVYKWPLRQLVLELNEFRSLNIGGLKFNALSRWYKWATELEQRLNQCELMIDEGRKFFQTDNLALLRFATENIALRDVLSRTIWNYDAAAGEVKNPKKTKAWKRMMKGTVSETEEDPVK